MQRAALHEPANSWKRSNCGDGSAGLERLLRVRSLRFKHSHNSNSLPPNTEESPVQRRTGVDTSSSHLESQLVASLMIKHPSSVVVILLALSQGASPVSALAGLFCSAFAGQ